MRIGLIGCGAVANFGHLPAIVQTHGLQLASLYDPDAGNLEKAAADFGGQPFSEIGAFFRSGLDAVVVTSPAPAHRQNVLDAAKHGLHVLCEKPIAMNDTEAAEMIAAMKKANRMLLVGFVYRFSPVALQFKQWIEDGVVGEIRSLRLFYVWNLHGQFEHLPDGNWIESPAYHGRMIEGGPLVDCGVHQIDLCRYWLEDEVADYSARGAWVVDGYEAPDHVGLSMQMAKGAAAFIEVSYSYGHTARFPRSEFSYHAIGTGGVLRYDRDGYVLEARTGQDTLHLAGASEKNFPGMYEAFRNSLLVGEPAGFPTAADGLIATRIARTATEQAISARLKTPG